LPFPSADTPYELPVDWPIDNDFDRVDSLALVLSREYLTQRSQSELAGRETREPWHTTERTGGTCEENCTFSSREHVGKDALAGPESAKKVDLGEVCGLLSRCVEDRAAIDSSSASIVNKYVYGAQICTNALEAGMTVCSTRKSMM
jgi:hypothetical protein